MGYLVGGGSGEEWGARREGGKTGGEEDPLGEMDHKHMVRRNSKYEIYRWGDCQASR